MSVEWRSRVPKSRDRRPRTGGGVGVVGICPVPRPFFKKKTEGQRDRRVMPPGGRVGRGVATTRRGAP